MEKRYKAYRFENAEELNKLIEIYGENHFSHIPNHKITGGGYLYEKAYPIQSWSGYNTREYFQTDLMNWNYPKIEVLQDEWMKPKTVSPMEKDLLKAKELMGKNVYLIDGGASNKGIVSEIKVYFEKSYKTTDSVDRAIEKNGYSVAVYYGSCVSDVNSVDLVAKSITVKLNDKHTAEVFPHKVVVGCQTFYPSAIEELYKALKHLQ